MTSVRISFWKLSKIPACMRIILLTSIFIHCLMVKGQSFDEIISSNRYIDCQDVSYNAAQLVEQFYKNNQIDSIYLFLDYWETKCGPAEPIIRLRTILDIKTGQLESTSISEHTISSLLEYRRRLEPGEFYNYYHPFPGLRNPGLDQSLFNSLTQKIAQSTPSNDGEESLLLDFYSMETPNFEIIKNASNTNKLNRLHNETYQKALRESETHVAFVTGTIQHYSNLSLFGTRPSLGFALGGKKLRHNYDFILDLRIGPSKEDYTFMYQNALITDNTWTGLYLGLEYTFDFIQTRKIDIGLSPGAGFDRITALTVDNDYGEDAKFLPGFNKNMGLVIKYKYGKRSGYMGLHVRYNWANYHNPGGTALDGQYLNIRYTIGVIDNRQRASKLKILE